MQKTEPIQYTKQSPGNAEEQINKNSSEEMEIYEHIEGTPFHLKGSQKDGYQATSGNYIITEKYKSKEELIEYIHTKPWELYITLISLVINIREQIKNDILKQQEKSAATANPYEDWNNTQKVD